MVSNRNGIQTYKEAPQLLHDRARGNSKASTQLPEETAKEPAAATGKSSKALHLGPVTAFQKNPSQ